VNVSQTLRRGTRNGIKELSPRAPAIFCRAAITLGQRDGRPVEYRWRRRWASVYILVAQVNNVLCTFSKQEMIVLAVSEVNDMKVT